VNERRVLLGIASGGVPTAPFLEALARMQLPANVAPLQRSIVMGNFVPAQRELIMQDAVAGNYDYLFFIDDDVVFPANALELLHVDVDRRRRRHRLRLRALTRRRSAKARGAVFPRARVHRAERAAGAFVR